MSDARLLAADDSGATFRVARLLAADDSGATFRVAREATAREVLLGLGVSKPQAARVLAEGRLRVGEAALAAGSRVAAGAEVRLAFCPGRPAAQVEASVRRARGAAPRVLAQDAFLLVVEKPAGIIVHGDGTGAETLTDRVRALLLDAGLPGAAARAQAVQRLDEETTGVVVFSLTEEFQGSLDALAAGHAMRKRYLAIVRGTFPAGPRTIDAPIGRDRHDARRMRVSPGGKPSVTRVARLDVGRGFSLVGCELGTGRRHQIRVHLASLGHPIVGDTLYGGPRSQRGLMLHAAEESFAHPVTGEPVVARTAWPQRFGGLFGERDVVWGIL